ncbi:hypothetical protein ACWCXB_20330 [Streptomyces sp. NPDC001514]
MPGGDRQAFARLIVQVWTETLRNERLAAVLHDGYAGMRRACADVVGRLPGRWNPGRRRAGRPCRRDDDRHCDGLHRAADPVRRCAGGGPRGRLGAPMSMEVPKIS